MEPDGLSSGSSTQQTAAEAEQQQPQPPSHHRRFSSSSVNIDPYPIHATHVALEYSLQWPLPVSTYTTIAPTISSQHKANNSSGNSNNNSGDHNNENAKGKVVAIDLLSNKPQAGAGASAFPVPLPTPPPPIPLSEGAKKKRIGCVGGGLGKIVEVFLEEPRPTRRMAFLLPWYDNLLADVWQAAEPRHDLSDEANEREVRMILYGPAEHLVLLIRVPGVRERPAPKIYEHIGNAIMLHMLSSWSSAVAAVVRQLRIHQEVAPTVVLHDHHACLAMYSADWPGPEAVRIILILHNAHLQGEFVLDDKEIREILEKRMGPWPAIPSSYDAFTVKEFKKNIQYSGSHGNIYFPTDKETLREYGLRLLRLVSGQTPRTQCENVIEDLRWFDHLNCLQGGVRYLLAQQGGFGAVAVSPPYARKIPIQIPLLAALPKVHGIYNAVMDSDKAHARKGMHAIDKARREAKARLRVRYGWKSLAEEQSTNNLNTSSDSASASRSSNSSGGNSNKRKSYGGMGESNPDGTGISIDDDTENGGKGDDAKECWVCFMGRLTAQKGIAHIASPLAKLLQKRNDVFVLLGGPTGDKVGVSVIPQWQELERKFPTRCRFVNGMITGDERDDWQAAIDFFLVPSEYEPCGLTDIEFGVRGAIPIVHKTGGLGKTPCIAYQTGTYDKWIIDRTMEDAINTAVTLDANTRAFIRHQSLRDIPFNLEAMVDNYFCYFAEVAIEMDSWRLSRKNRERKKVGIDFTRSALGKTMSGLELSGWGGIREEKEHQRRNSLSYSSSLNEEGQGNIYAGSPSSSAIGGAAEGAGEDTISYFSLRHLTSANIGMNNFFVNNMNHENSSDNLAVANNTAAHAQSINFNSEDVEHGMNYEDDDDDDENLEGVEFQPLLNISKK